MKMVFACSCLVAIVALNVYDDEHDRDDMDDDWWRPLFEDKRDYRNDDMLRTDYGTIFDDDYADQLERRDAHFDQLEDVAKNVGEQAAGPIQPPRTSNFGIYFQDTLSIDARDRDLSFHTQTPVPPLVPSQSSALSSAPTLAPSMSSFVTSPTFADFRRRPVPSPIFLSATRHETPAPSPTRRYLRGFVQR